MRVVVAPTQLHIEPVRLRRLLRELVLVVVQQRRLAGRPAVRRRQQNVRRRGVHLVRLARVDRQLLHALDRQIVQLLVEHLTQIRHHVLVDLLPQMRAEDLDQRDLQRRNLAVHENARQIQLYLETHVHVRAVDRRRPPQREPTVRNLVQTASLRVRQLLVLHRLLETRRLLPEQTLPRRERRRLEQRVLQNRFHATQMLDHVRAVVVQVPQTTVVALVRPPHLVVPQQRVLLEHQTHAVALVVRQRVTVLLEQRVDARQTQLP